MPYPPPENSDPLDESWQRLKDLVADAFEQPPESRVQFLEDACGGRDSPDFDAAYDLLQAASSTDEFLETRVLESRVMATPPPESALSLETCGPSNDSWVGRRIDNYEVVRYLAAGGMGIVYEAVQQQTGRRVALKLMRQLSPLTSIETDQSAGTLRFQREVEVLGRLQHDSIAQVLDAGHYLDDENSEHPYFVLEYIDGASLTRFAELRDDRERLRLVIQICDGVQHAHERGVVHRDLKPDNILVTADGRVKVLDFGIARLVGHDAGVTATTYTRTGQLLGTLAYMSPEQLEGDTQKVDRRSDVYALGVILYELLARRLPFDPRQGTLFETATWIRNVDAAPLSSFDRSYRGDLETIAAKALSKEKSRRYATAAELADDLRRHLDNEPISARPPTTWYQLTKFARRNRLLCGSVATALVLLTLGIVGTGLGYFEARHERNLARIDRDRAVAAERESEAVNNFLSTLLGSTDPQQRGRDVRVREILDIASRDLEHRFAELPGVRARLHSVIGWTYFSLGEYDDASNHMRNAVELRRELDGDAARSTLDDESRWVQVLLALDDREQAERLTASSLQKARTTYGETDPALYVALGNRALWLGSVGRDDEANALFQQSIDGFRNHVGELDNFAQSAINNHAIVVASRGQLQLAVDMLFELVRFREQQLGAEHPSTLMSRLNLAYAWGKSQRIDESVDCFETWLPVMKRVLGAQHPDYLSQTNNFGAILSTIGRQADAVEYYQLTYDGQIAALGREHTDTLITLNNLCVSLLYLKRFVEAEPMARALVEGLERSVGKDDFRYWRAAGTLGNSLAALAQNNEAAQWLRTALDSHRTHLGEDHFQTILSKNNYAQFLRDIDRRSEAVAPLKDVVDRYRRLAPEDARTQSIFQFNYGRLLAELDRREDAMPELRSAHALSVSSWGAEHERTQRIADLISEIAKKEDVD